MMKFLSQPLPKLTITRTSRKAIVNEVTEIITLYETTTRIEVTLPSLVRGIKEAFTRFAEALTSMFLPRVYAY